MKNLYLILIVLVLLGCGAHLPVDVGPNYASKSFHSIEFDVSTDSDLVNKEIGIANIFLKKNSDYSNVTIKIYGIYKGTLILKSNACGIDLTTNFEGEKKFKLSELISEPTKCSIGIVAVSDPIGGKEHNIIESGVLKINVIDDNDIPLKFSYFKNNNTLKEYSFTGQGSLQRSSGSLTANEKINFFPNDADGGIYRIFGCGFEHIGSFENNFFDVPLKNIYKKDSLEINDSCDFEILIISNSQEFSHKGRLSINIYDSSLIKLEQPEWSIRKITTGKRILIVEGKPHVAICSINTNYSIKNREQKPVVCKENYIQSKIFWVRTVTSNGRKNVFAIKNGSIYWQDY
jgi:hypothetical protein